MAFTKIAYEPHPVTPERKRELNAQGFKIIDARFRHPLDHDGDGRKGGSLPKAEQSAQGSSESVLIPDGWRDLPWIPRDGGMSIRSLASSVTDQPIRSKADAEASIDAYLFKQG